MPAKPQPVVTYLTVDKEGTQRDRMREDGHDPTLPPVIDGMYVHKYITARFGNVIKVTIEAAD